MQCPKCGSNDITTTVTNVEKKKGKHGTAYWLLVGWWLQPVVWIIKPLLWILFGWNFMLLWRASHPIKKTKLVNVTMAVCQTCGHTWTIGNNK